MTPVDSILAARALLAAVTPLRGDCGARCGAACCQPDEDGQGGMLLYPGEEALYPGADWYTLEKTGITIDGVPLVFLTCNGACPRGERPLACRVFPLTPTCEGDAPGVALDVRAWPVCPLMPHGMQGLGREFVAAAQAAAALLWQDAACRAYVRWLAGEMRAYGQWG